jgi:hypothetical protein
MRHYSYYWFSNIKLYLPTHTMLAAMFSVFGLLQLVKQVAEHPVVWPS